MAYLKSVLCTLLLLFKKPDVLLTFPPSPSNLCYSIAFEWWNIQFQEQRNMYPLQFVLFSYLQVKEVKIEGWLSYVREIIGLLA